MREARADAQAAAGQEKLSVLEIEDIARRLHPPEGDAATEAGMIPVRVEVRVTCTY